MFQAQKRGALSVMGLALLGFLAAPALQGATGATPTASAASSFTCTEVLGFSQTNNWYTEGGNFEPLVGDAGWQERWYSGGSIDLWSYADGAPWYASLLSNCAANSGAPDRVLINISGAYQSDPAWWQAQTQGVINALANNTGHGYNNDWSNVTEIVLQSVVGGPNGTQCSTTDTQPAVQYGINRASYNWPFINQGIDLVVNANASLMSSNGHSVQVIHGASPTVDSCSDFADGVGHLSPAAKTYMSTRLGQYYASGAVAPTPTRTPVATSTSTSVPGATPTRTAVPPVPTATVTSSGGCPCGLFSYSGLPDTADQSDSSAVELGLKFRSDSVGDIMGVRFYKGAGNTGTHLGNLWSATGQLLSSVTFTNESATGWQVATFASPVHILANTTYVASYHTNVGHYASTRNGLANQVDYSMLHGLATGAAGGNGVYRYAAASSFPDQTYAATNYWVDVVFVPGAGTANGTPTPVPATPTRTPTARPATSTPTRAATSTPVAQATATPSAGGQVINFDALASPDRPLVSQEAGTGVNFGNGVWWLARPWAKFTTNSISFNGAGPTSAVIGYTTPRTLLQLDAYNGGTASTTVTISCAGQTSKVITLAANQLATIPTGFNGTCSSVTIGSTNGWDTNFDSLRFL